MAATTQTNFRIVYILRLNRTGGLECTAHSTTLMKWDAFSGDATPFEKLFGKRFAGGLDDADRKLAARLRWSCDTRSDDVAVLGGTEGHDLFRALVATGRAFWSKGRRTRLVWEDSTLPVTPEWRVLPGEFHPVLRPEDPAAVVLPLSPPVYLIPESALCGPVSGAFGEGLLARWAEAKPMGEEKTRSFCMSLFDRYPGERFPLPEGIRVESAEPAAGIVPELRLGARANVAKGTGSAPTLNDMVLVNLRFRYGKRRVEADAETDTVTYKDGGRLVRMPRDYAFEAECFGRLRDLGFEAAPSENMGELLSLDAGGFVLSGQASTRWEDLLGRVFPSLEEAGWAIEYAPGFRLQTVDEANLYSGARRGDSWFDYYVGFEYNGNRFSVVEPLREFISAHRSLEPEALLEKLESTDLPVMIESGKFLVVPGRLLRTILSEVIELLGEAVSGDAVRLPPWRAAELSERGLLDEDAGAAGQRADRQALRGYLEGGLDLSPLEPPAALRADLRDYQKSGLRWLRFLRETGTHGILADDMGLGKTLQTIGALLDAAGAGCLDGPSLIVAPTSVLDNWRSEIERFAPSLACRIYHGTGRRADFGDLAEGGVVVTSYAVLRNDIERLEAYAWSYLVIDEAQFVKNPESRSARALCRLSARHKLCLTGTPIENDLSELWSLFHFLMPDFLGSRRLFRRTYANPIASETRESRALAERLRKRIAPFVLRRTKEEVARELPRKTEIVHPVELHPDQAERYEAVRTAMNAKVAEELESRGLARSRIVVLDALLKLRQLCCDPRLYENDAESAKPGSAKLEALMELLPSLLDNGHRILLFSQFTSMLELIGTELEQTDYAYRSLTGATRDRPELVRAFQAGEFPLLLISLKAGGTGLNLTAADTVIHYDPWWNPAAEAQATDRTHRIGQDRPVFVYKLIAENTVEAKILELQRKKGRLARSLLENDAESPAENFSEDDIRRLFEY